VFRGCVKAGFEIGHSEATSSSRRNSDRAVDRSAAAPWVLACIVLLVTGMAAELINNSIEDGPPRSRCHGLKGPLSNGQRDARQGERNRAIDCLAHSSVRGAHEYSGSSQSPRPTHAPPLPPLAGICLKAPWLTSGILRSIGAGRSPM